MPLCRRFSRTHGKEAKRMPSPVGEIELGGSLVDWIALWMGNPGNGEQFWSVLWVSTKDRDWNILGNIINQIRSMQFGWNCTTYIFVFEVAQHFKFTKYTLRGDQRLEHIRQFFERHPTTIARISNSPKFGGKGKRNIIYVRIYIKTIILCESSTDLFLIYSPIFIDQISLDHIRIFQYMIVIFSVISHSLLEQYYILVISHGYIHPL